MSILRESAVNIIDLAHPDAHLSLGWREREEMTFEVLESPEVLYRLYLQAAMYWHPFLGGEASTFQQLRESKQRIDAHHRAVQHVMPMLRA